MKTIKNITLKNTDGSARVEATTKEVLNSLSLIRLAFNNVRFKNRQDQRLADKIYVKLEATAPEVESFEVEDAEFDVIFKYCTAFETYLQGRAFNPFLAELERVENPPPVA